MNARKLLAMVTARSRRAPILLVLLTAAGGGAVRGDWLVLASGEQIETKGPWTLEGRKVVFTSTRGVLSSVRASSVNVESSRTLTAKKHEEATAVVVAAPAPKREPVLVLTDADFAPKPAVPAGAVVVPTGEAGAEAVTAGEPVVVPATDTLETRVARQMPGPPAVKITSWSVRPSGEDQLSIFGTVQNVGSMVAAAITVDVKLIDSEGAQVGATEAEVSTTALMPDLQGDFEARFAGNPNFSTVEFTVDTVELEIGRSNGAPPEGAAEGAAAEGAEGTAAPVGGRAVVRPSGQQPKGDEPHSAAAGESAQPEPE